MPLVFNASVDEWANFLERINCDEINLMEKVRKKEKEALELRLWASYRGQTLARTGMNAVFVYISKFLLTMLVVWQSL